MRNLFKEGESGEVGENVELLDGRGSPVGESMADGEAFTED